MTPLIRGMIDFLVLEFNLSEPLGALLKTVSLVTINRKLRKAKDRYRLKGNTPPSQGRY